MARGYAKEERWDDVTRLYSDALKCGCLSDGLALLALQSVSQGQIGGKMRILRSIVDDIASHKNIKSGTWIFENYWVIKRMLGFHYARLLMWWNDPTTTQEEELKIAIQHFEESNRTNSDIDPDIIRCIIKLAGREHEKVYGKSSNTGTEAPINSQNEAVNLIVSAVYKSFEVHERLSHSSILSDGVKALKSLGADKHCVDLVLAGIDRGFKIKNDALRIAKNVAVSQGNDSALDIMESKTLP